MISLEQVKQLDLRVKKAVNAIKVLSTENSVLKQQVKELEARLGALSKEATERRADEEQLEVSLQSVLDTLDEVDGETSEIEPEIEAESPAAGNVIETVPEEEENSDIPFTPGPGEVEVEDEVISSVSEDSSGKTAEDTGVEASSEPAAESQTEDIPDEETVAEESAASTEEAAIPVSEPEPEPGTEEDNNTPETINLDAEKDDEGFQSEFDIF